MILNDLMAGGQSARHRDDQSGGLHQKYGHVFDRLGCPLPDAEAVPIIDSIYLDDGDYDFTPVDKDDAWNNARAPMISMYSL